jgi:hypothetical protein
MNAYLLKPQSTESPINVVHQRSGSKHHEPINSPQLPHASVDHHVYPSHYLEFVLSSHAQ